MEKYAILANPGHNRVYFETSKRLATLELEIVLSNYDSEILNIQNEMISDIFYITFQSVAPLTDDMLSAISRLSFLYAFFQMKEIEGTLYLCPILKADIEYINPNISSILKYTGKTNEIFTRMLINIGLFSSPYAGEEINLLDPIAGKGTTLYEGLIFGHNCYGIEIADKVVLESYHYMKKFLENERYKHVTKKEALNSRDIKSTKYSIAITGKKETTKDNNPKQWTMVSGNATYADFYFKKEFFHLIVGDLPYGVQHGNVTAPKQSGITRNPKELVRSCIKSWYHVLKKEGVLVLSWNSFLLSREEFGAVLESAGFKVLSSDAYLQFEHRVDQAIKRDIIVAKK